VPARWQHCRSALDDRRSLAEGSQYVLQITLGVRSTQYRGSIEVVEQN
jgi:hypothetical protein